MSEFGAKLIFSNKVGALPSQFVLLLARDGRVARQCRLAWKYGEEVGVEFIARLTRTLAAVWQVASVVRPMRRYDAGVGEWKTV